MTRSQREGRVAVLVALVTALGAGCTPTPPAYPYYGPYGSEAGVRAEAQRMSNALDQYIRDWMDGRVPAQIPANLLPPGREPRLGAYVLQRPSEVDPSRQWGVRPAHTIDFNNAYGLFPDPHATYLLNPAVFVPFGHRIIIEGDFPRARYFSIQAMPAFQPTAYRYGPAGLGDVAWVDADIEPLPGHTNPFRVGANRNATNRSFRITCDVTMGDPTVLDSSAWQIPFYRAPGDNSRFCSGLVFRGPWGAANSDSYLADKVGLWEDGDIWIRYYANDHSAGTLGGVRYPRILYELPDGRQYFIQADYTNWERFANGRRALTSQAPQAPTAAVGPGVGWDKQMDILRSVYGGIVQGSNQPSSDPLVQRQYVRDINRGVSARGEELQGVRSREPHSTGGVHINYLTRGMCLEAGRVFAISGRMPRTPRTRSGEAAMSGGEARYWSITGYSQGYDVFNPDYVYGAEITSVMDDEIVTDAEGDYVIVYSRPQDRPANATAANGVTWVNWGPEACQSFTLRWITIGPEWSFARSPHQGNLSWNASWASASYNPALVGRNNRSGFLGAYHPVVSYLTRAQFEGLGRPDGQTMPAY